MLSEDDVVVPNFFLNIRNINGIFYTQNLKRSTIRKNRDKILIKKKVEYLIQITIEHRLFSQRLEILNSAMQMAPTSYFLN